MRSLRAPVTLLAVTAIALSSPAIAAEKQGPAIGVDASTSAMQPMWQSVPQMVVPERSKLIRVLIDDDGHAHLFFVTNEGASVPAPVSVTSWNGSNWSSLVRLGPTPDPNFYSLAVPASATSGIPTVGWALYGTVYMARFQNGAWSVASGEVEGFDPAKQGAYSYGFATVGTAADGTSVGLLGSYGSCPAAAGVLGCEWTVKWPKDSTTVTVADNPKRGCCGMASFWVSDSGVIEALATKGSGPVYQIVATSIRDGRWTEEIPVAEFRGYSFDYSRLRVVRDGDRLVAVWNQTDLQFGEDRQVAASQRVAGSWLPAQVLANDVEFGGLTVASSDGPACARYIHQTTRETFARVLAGSAWGAPISMDDLGRTSPSDTACLFARSEVDDFEIGNAVVGVAAATVFSAPEIDPRTVTTSRGRAWSVQIEGRTLTAARLTFARGSAPTAPTNVVARPLKGAIQVTWSAPVNPGTGPYSYEYRTNSGKWVKTSKTQVSIKSPRGKRVSIGVRAVNAAGASPVVTVSGAAK